MNDAVRNATASATDSLWRASNEARRRAEAEQPYPVDADCRYATNNADHRCVDCFGAPVREGGSCHYEARAQLEDQRRRERLALQHGFAIAAGLEALPLCSEDGEG